MLAASVGSTTANPSSLWLDFMRTNHGTSQLQPGAVEFSRDGGTAGNWTGANQTDSRSFPFGSGSITVTVTSGASGGSSYGRNETNASFSAFEYRSLYRDGLCRLKVSETEPFLTISGLPSLPSGQQYEVTMWAYDALFSDGQTLNYFDVTNGGSTPVGSYTNVSVANGAVFTSLNDYSVSGIFAPHNGTLAFAQTGISGGSKISGLLIRVVTPADVLIDFMRTNHSSSQLQPGAVEFSRDGGTAGNWTGANQTDSRSFPFGTGSITVTVVSGASGGSSYGRNETNASFSAFEYRSLYRDGLCRLKVSSTQPFLELTGLSSGSDYEVTFWAYDALFSDGATLNFYNVTGGVSTPIGSYNNVTVANGATFPSTSAFSVSGTFTPVNGALAFAQTGISGGSKISGVRVRMLGASSPEPAMMIGQGLGGITYYTQPVFANTMNHSRQWLTFDAYTGASTSNINSPDTYARDSIPQRTDGYPTHLPFAAKGSDHVVETNLPVYENGEHQFSFQGKGTVRISGPGVGTQIYNKTTAGTFTVSLNASGTADLSAFDSSGMNKRRTPSLWTIRITSSDASDPIRDMCMLRPGMHSAGRYAFDPTLLSLASHWPVLRFMDWMRTNHATVTQYHSANTHGRDYYTQEFRGVGGAGMWYIIQMANQLNKSIWVNVPHQMVDSSVTAMANYIAQNLNPGLKCYLEYSNEVWNTQFSQYSWVRDNVPGQNIPQRYGVRAREVFELFASRFAAQGRTSDLRRVLAGQAANTWHLAQALITAGDRTDCIAIAPYFGASYDAGQAPSFAQLESDLQAASNQARTWTLNHRALADQWGKELVAYEGGQHLKGKNEAANQDVALQAQLIEFNRNYRMRDLYRWDYLYKLQDGGLDLFMHFVLLDTWTNRGGCWGSVEYYFQPVGPGSGQAVKEWALREWDAAHN